MKDASFFKGKSADFLFAQDCRFVAGAATFDRLPPEVCPEVAFVGRSNVGKSSLINALTGRKTLARTSKTPGRTQQINFFSLAGVLQLVDLPGYGYAKVSKAQVKEWTALMCDYLRVRSALRRVYVLVDSRHGLKPSDKEMMALLDQHAVSYQIVLTKADKSSEEEMQACQCKIVESLKHHPAAHPLVLVTSAEKNKNIAILREEIWTLCL